MKGRGKLVISNQDKAIELIQKLVPEEEHSLLNMKITIDKKALEKLDAKLLKKLGCQIVQSGDRVVISRAESQEEKNIQAIIQEGLEEIREAA